MRAAAVSAVVLSFRASPPGALGSLAPDAFSPLRGEYGFISDFDKSTAEDAARSVRFMQSQFGIMEFEFSNVFEGFSSPPPAHKGEWTCAYFSSRVRQEVLAAAVEQVARLGGRAWLRLDPAATDPGDEELQAGFVKVRTQQNHSRPLKDLMLPGAEWARRVVPRWAEFAAASNFSGILWSTDVMPSDLNGSGLAHAPDFLRAARPLLEGHGLTQAWNFRDRSEWAESLRSEVAFPYFTAWSPETLDWALRSPDSPGCSVVVCYPGHDSAHRGESWNRDSIGVPPLDLGVSRWQEARCKRSAYLLIGDGIKYVKTDYLPHAGILNMEQIKEIVYMVFENMSCPGDLWDWDISAGTDTTSMRAGTAAAMATRPIADSIGPMLFLWVGLAVMVPVLVLLACGSDVQRRHRGAVVLVDSAPG